MNKKHIVYILFCAAAAASCSRKAFVPENGDLIFQTAGISAASQAIASATAQHDSIQYDHVGIIEVSGGQIFVIEATGRRGVVRTPWDEFLSSAPSVGGKPGVTVKRVVLPEENQRRQSAKNSREKRVLAGMAVRRAASFLGQEYDWYYLPDNGKLYCSELVYEAWLDAAGNHIFETKPMNFRDSDGNMPQYWTELFSRLGEPVPEGIPGTNPNDMSKSPALKEVYRGF